MKPGVHFTFLQFSKVDYIEVEDFTTTTLILIETPRDTWMFHLYNN